MRLYLVCPCYNESLVIRDSAKELNNLLDGLMNDGSISKDSRIVFVDDGSVDSTWSIICELHNVSSVYEGLKLSCNKGHQTAIFAGIEYASKYADAIITIDIDLQQDINAIPEFLRMYADGYEVINGVRNSRKTDGVLKKTTALAYYGLIRALGCDVIKNSADYRLLSKNAAIALTSHKESNLFIRGIVPTLGFKSGILYFDVKERKAGESKYTLRKMVKLALDGITSFTIKPIRMILCFGMMITIISVIMLFYILFTYIVGQTLPGWASLAIAIWFLGGVELVGIGVVGEYVGRTYMESKNRPRYFLEDTVTDHDESSRY